ncbi:hypothetical protein Ancab_014329 [Ancistrocladus abbreviatus]
MGASSPDHNHRGNHQQGIQLFQLDHTRLDSLHQKLTTPPRLLSKSAGRPTCSIFKIPRSFVDVNGQSLYYPHIVSIGPFHRNKPHLQMIEEHKYQYLSQLLSRTELTLQDLFNSLQPLEKSARESYSEIIHLDEQEFLEMMVVDGCFVLELFRKVGKLVRFQADDPIASMSWVFSFLLRDLLRLENQLPWFVLERLLEVTGSENERSSGWSLASLSLNFFSYAVEKLDAGKFHHLQGQHLLDLLRTAFIPQELETRQRDLSHISTPSHVIHCASKLRRSGIRIRPAPADSFLIVKFRHGVIEMPTVTIDDFMSAFFANCVAYELNHQNCTTYMTTYATLLDCLVNSAKDVEYLSDHNIIENYFGTEAEVAGFINNLGKDVTFDIERCYLAQLFNDVNHYYRNSWHVHWASFEYTYFNTPWSFISATAAFVLLVLAVLQTLYTIFSYYKSG